MKKLLLLGLVMACHGLWAQTDEPEANTTLLEESTSYECENKVTGNFQGFSPSAAITCPGKQEFKTLWYRLQPAKTARYAIAVDQLGIGGVNLFIYEGSASNLTAITSGCSTRYTQMDFEAGKTYYLSITGEFSTTEYAACIFALPEPPSNDEAENAIAMELSTYGECENQMYGHAIGATVSEENACYGNRDDVWYTFTPSATSNYTFILERINNSAVSGVGVYEGTPGNLSLISYGDDDITAVGCEGNRAKVTLEANTTYYVNVSIGNTSRVTYFNLCTYETPAPPSNDNCDNAIELTVGGDFDKSAIVADITSATREERHIGPNCDFFEWVSPNGNGKDVWFTATIPASGNLIVETRAFSDAEEQFLNDTGMQSFVAGTCDALEPYRYSDPGYDQDVYCNKSFYENEELGHEFAGMRFTNKTPGDKVLFRVYPWAHQYGKFKIAAYDDSSLSVTEFDKNGFAFFPNPTTDVVNVKYIHNLTSLTVNNLLGKTVMTVNPNSKNAQLDLSALASGMYIVTAKSDRNEVTNFKVVKK
ncbi:T9SS type A sorting domain-containing protein [Formosa sp. A9]|uniref:T9SS type A sorting domain-containing protein n=1 Tax=Formosa sp. A9 TaxID=3442641 RepID=UPI003EC133EC